MREEREIWYMNSEGSSERGEREIWYMNSEGSRERRGRYGT